MVTSQPKESGDLEYLNNDIETPISEHLVELQQRFLVSLIFVLALSVGCLVLIKPIVELIQHPATGVKFLQFSPGEYFFTTVKLAFYSGFLISFPFTLYQVILFILPGLSFSERRTFLPILAGSVFLFSLGVIFSYQALIPAALKFFLSYSEGTIEPLWSFDQYCEFIISLLFLSGLAFQLPVAQVLLGMFGLVTSQMLLKNWKFVVVGSTIVGATLTPSTDPVTQLLLSSAILLLFFLGVGVVFITEKMN
jgi:sec-independent protein translocase protein TatC